MTKIIIASGPVIVENDKVLLDQHGDTTFWKFCGGQVENFENDLIETARLKTKKELGIEKTSSLSFQEIGEKQKYTIIPM